MKNSAAFAALCAATFVLATNLLSAAPGTTISSNSTTPVSLSSGTETISNGVTLNVGSSGTATVASVAITATGTSTIINNGTIEQTGSDGSQNGRAIRDNTGGFLLTVVNNGLIETADADVIQMNKKSSNIIFDNYGTLDSLNASAGGAQAIDFNAITTGTNILHNHAGGVIEASEADAVRPGVNGVVTNDGLIKSTTTTGSSSDGIDAQSNSGIDITNAYTLVDNTGTGTIEGGRHGITGGNTDTTTDGTYLMSITNNAGGTIQGDNGSGINIDGFSAQEVVTIVNAGTIIGNGVTGDGDGVDVDGLVNLNNTGTIVSTKAFDDASEGVTVGGGTIVNSGTIEGDNINGGVGRGITLAGLDKDPTTDDAIPIEKIFADTTVDNSGLIKGQTDSGIAILGLTGTTNYTVTITNEAAGTIEGSGTNAVIEAGATVNNETVINYGKIVADSTGKAINLGSGTNSVQILGGSASVIGDMSGGTGSSTITIDPGTGHSFSYSGVISNFNSGMQINSGTVTLTGTNTFTGTTTVSGGQLEAGNLYALGAGDVINGGGTLSTDGINRTIMVEGSYKQTAGAMAFTVNNAGNDKLMVNGLGTSTFGGNLDVDFTGYGAQLGQAKTTKVFTLVTTVNGYTQTLTFDPTNLENGDTASLDFSTVPDDILLDVNTKAGVFSTIGLNPNQQIIVNNINTSLNNSLGSPLFTALGSAVMANPGAEGVYLDELSSEKFGVFTSETAFNNASFDTQAMDGYLAGQRSGPNGTFAGGNGGIDASGLTINDPSYDPNLAMVHSRLMAYNAAPFSGGLLSDVANPLLGGADMKDSKDTKSVSAPEYANPWNFYVRGSVTLAQGFSQANVPHFDDNTESVVLGTDYRFTPNFLIGLTAGYAHTDVTLDTNGSSATVDSYSPGFYASYADHGWYANLSGEYLHNAYTQDRVIGFLGQTASSAPEGNEGVANLDGGYDFHRGALTFGPIAGLQYTHLSVDGYNESGSIADLSVTGNDSDSLRSRLGGTISYAFNHAGIAITPHLDASWQHEFLDQSRGITSQFGFGGGSFDVRTPNPSRESALIDAGVTADLNRTVSVFTDYIVQAGQDNYFGQSVQAGVKIGF